MVCRIPYTINISIIHIIIQYFFVLNVIVCFECDVLNMKFSVINLLEKNDCGPPTDF